MQPHQQRVVDEKTELDSKLEKLKAFYASSIFAGLPEDEQVRMKHQGSVMEEYSQILGERIAHFPQ